VSSADAGIRITPDDVLKTRGLGGMLDDMTLEQSPHGGHLVAIAQYQGCNVCWGCCEPFDISGPERMVEVLPPIGDSAGHRTPVGLHAKCVDPKARKKFFDMRSNALQSVEDVGAALRLRRFVGRAVKPFAGAAAAAKKIIVG